MGLNDGDEDQDFNQEDGPARPMSVYAAGDATGLSDSLPRLENLPTSDQRHYQILSVNVDVSLFF